MIEEINKHIADLEKIKLKNIDELEKFRINFVKGIIELYEKIVFKRKENL